MNTKLHAVVDARGRPIELFMSAGQISDYIRSAALLGSLTKARWLLADRDYDDDWLKEALKDKGINVCIPGRKPCKRAVKYDKKRYQRRNCIEIMFGRLRTGADCHPIRPMPGNFPLHYRLCRNSPLLVLKLS
jgi:transposase